MYLTNQGKIRDPEKFPTVQLFLLGTILRPGLGKMSIETNCFLAIVRLAEPIALTSIFPYAWPLVKKFNVGDEHDASFYAGLLISAFALSESMTGMFWGGLSDRIGRKPVLLAGCFGTMISMVMVGFASNIWVALAGRAIGGILVSSSKLPYHLETLLTGTEWKHRCNPNNGGGTCHQTGTRTSSIQYYAFRLVNWYNNWPGDWRFLCGPRDFIS